MTQAQIGYGGQFGKGDGADPEVFTFFAEVVSISGPGLSRDSVDATHMQSPNQWREFLKGLKDGGEISLELNLVPGTATHSTILADFANDDTIDNWQAMWRDGSTWTFAGFCTSFSSEAPVEDKMSASATFKIAGEPTFVAAV